MQSETIPRIFRGTASRLPEKAAIFDVLKNESISYGDLKLLADKVAAALIDEGLQTGECASIWAPNMTEWVAAALGVQSAGGVLVPLNTRFKGKEAGYILEKSQARFLFCVGEFLDTDYLDLLHKAFGGPGEDYPLEEIKSLQKIIVLDFNADKKLSADSSTVTSWESFLSGGDKSELEKELEKRVADSSPQYLSDVLFTSGTTGLPKGVMTTHAQSHRGYDSWSKCVGLEEADRYLIVNPFFHSFGYKSGWLAAFMVGATIYPLPVFDPVEVMSTVEKHKITVLPGPPTLYQTILNHPDFGKYDLSSLRVAVTGAASIPVELIIEMREKLNFDHILTGYGLTESSGIATMCRIGDNPEIIATTSGRSIPDVEVIVAGEEGVEIQRGEPGEVWIRGYNITQGYLDDPSATAEAIDGEGWLHTGDIGIMNEAGYLRITDRKKDMFIMGGFNVYPAEVENILLSHPGVAQAAVVGVPEEKFGEVGAAFIIRRPAQKTDENKLQEMELIEWCRENMANYKVPRHINFVEELPLNASGKVLKYELRKILQKKQE